MIFYEKFPVVKKTCSILSGFNSRFINNKLFVDRVDKVVADGSEIALRGKNFENENYSHIKVSNIIVDTIKKIIAKPSMDALLIKELILI
jgi:hypothetical protein